MTIGTERHTLRLADDGTLDTVIECKDCPAVFRYNFDGSHCSCEWDCEHGEAAYEAFVDWALADATSEHIMDGSG